MYKESNNKASNYKNNPVYVSFCEAVDFFKSKGYEVQCKYNYLENPVKTKDCEILYNVCTELDDKFWLYLHLGKQKQYASLEIEQKYAKNVDISIFNMAQLRKSIPHYKLVFTNFNKVKSAFSSIWLNISNKKTPSAQNNGIEFSSFIDYLKKYEGKKYTRPDKAGDKAEEMKNWKKEGIEARKEFTELAHRIIEQIPDYSAMKCNNWVKGDGKTCCDYFWIEFKKREFLDFPHSISLSYKKNIEDNVELKSVLSIRIETNDAACSESEYKKHNRIAMLPLPDDSFYYQGVKISKSDNPISIRYNTQEDILTDCDNGIITKVRIIKILNKPYITEKTDEIIALAQETIKKMIPYYEYIFQTNKQLIQKNNRIIDDFSKEGQNMPNNKRSFDKNMILYGPPGTGKTYNTVCYAVAICEGKNIEDVIAEAKNDYSSVKERYDKLKNTGRIEFTTFHQSYGYEEFIEGIRPVMNDSEEAKTVEYEIADGIFKAFCEKNEKSMDSREAFETAWNELVKNAYENNAKFVFTRRTGTKIEATYLNDNKFRVEWTGGTHNDLTKTAIFSQWSDVSAVRNLFKGGNKWLFDARQAIIDEMKKYGLPEYDEKEAPPSVFIIDEINRGNISKIFGELITLIEPSKRLGQPEELRSILPYSKKPFGVPDNVYIIGTMNTADRSIAIIDTALRRRFSFKEMLPDAKILSGIEVDKINIENMLESMNNKISVLFDREHTIGHAYFMSLKDNPTIEMLANIFKNNIIPLLQEYFYEDYEKIRLVLGDNKKQDETQQFIKAISNDYSTLFGGDIDFDVSYRYEINESAFNLPEAYKYI